MLPFDPRPAVPPDRAAPIGRGLWCWPVLAVSLTLVLDALWPLLPEAGGHSLLWLDLAALGCLGFAALGARRARRRDWATPVDGCVLSGFVLAALHVVSQHGADEPVMWLRQIAATGLFYYALSARLRREPNAPDAVWPAFAMIVLALSAFALGSATGGVASLVRASQQVDAHWVSHFGLVKTLMLSSLLCVGRASEPGARALWRVTALIGVVVTALCTFVVGTGLGVASLASLNEPFYFCTSIIAFLLLANLARMAWQLAHDRPAEAGRWRAAAATFPVIAGLLMFGGTTGGEGVRAMLGLASVAVIAARLAPRGAAATPVPSRARAEEPPAARAA